MCDALPCPRCPTATTMYVALLPLSERTKQDLPCLQSFVPKRHKDGFHFNTIALLFFLSTFTASTTFSSVLKLMVSMSALSMSMSIFLLIQSLIFAFSQVMIAQMLCHSLHSSHPSRPLLPFPYPTIGGTELVLIASTLISNTYIVVSPNFLPPQSKHRVLTLYKG